MSDETNAKIQAKTSDIIKSINEFFEFIQLDTNNKDPILRRLMSCERELQRTNHVSSRILQTFVDTLHMLTTKDVIDT